MNESMDDNERHFFETLDECHGKIDCIISGAGISCDSGCPTGDQLKAVMWGLLWLSYRNDKALKKNLRDVCNKVATSPNLRMEQLAKLST